MNRTKIDWADYSINPIKGLCPVACSYCYARRMYKRYKWDETIRMEPDWMQELPKKPSRVFVGSTMELFGDWVEDYVWDSIWEYVATYPQHTFIFLTKRPENLQKWSPFPKNCWVGVSATNAAMALRGTYELDKVKASVKWLSIEPLLSWTTTAPGMVSETGNEFKDAGIGWIVVGQQTPVSAKTAPKVEWVREIVEAADNAKIPVFLKENLFHLLPLDHTSDWRGFYEPVDDGDTYQLRQEFPRVTL